MGYRVGLTGGIGSGKSAAANIFAELGAEVVDTDAIAHELTAAGGAAMTAIERAFGPDYVQPDGSLDRARMRRLVFADAQARRELEALLHPLIRAEVLERLYRSRAPYAIVVVPLLLESGAYRELVDRVLVVDCDEATQVSRTVARSGLTEAEVHSIMRAQIPRGERQARADDVLSNDGDMSMLRDRVIALHARYLAAARGCA
jgi:dephospho-CoA kinase